MCQVERSVKGPLAPRRHRAGGAPLPSPQRKIADQQLRPHRRAVGLVPNGVAGGNLRQLRPVEQRADLGDVVDRQDKLPFNNA